MGRYHDPAKFHDIPHDTTWVSLIPTPKTQKLDPICIARLGDGTVLVRGIDPEYRAEAARYAADARAGRYWYESESYRPIT